MVLACLSPRRPPGDEGSLGKHPAKGRVQRIHPYVHRHPRRLLYRRISRSVAVMLFYSLGELFQDKAVDKAKRNINALLDVRPETATVIRNGSTLVEAPQRVQVGETIEVKAGERVPLDGTMLDEVAAFNTSALTGESVPRNIRQGEEVLAGMIATDKVVRIQVTKPFEKSALSRILELVQNASERKAPAELSSVSLPVSIRPPSPDWRH